MAKYVVTLETIASTAIEVEADSEFDAREAAWESDEFPWLCHQCSGGGRFDSQNLELGDAWEIGSIYEVEDD